MKSWEQGKYRRITAVAGIVAGSVVACLQSNPAIYIGLALALIGAAWLLLQKII